MYAMQQKPLLHEELTNSLLLEQACAGDQSAFETLVQRYQQVLYRFVRTRLSTDQADDVLQFVWFQLYLSLHKLQCTQSSQRKDMSLKPWLFRIAWNRCIDEQRKQRRHPWVFFSEFEQVHEEDELSLLSTFRDGMPLPEEIVEQDDENAHLRAALQSLPSTSRNVVWLRYTEELTFAEIGQKLHIPPTTAQTSFYRACKKLRLTLAPDRLLG